MHKWLSSVDISDLHNKGRTKYQTCTTRAAQNTLYSAIHIFVRSLRLPSDSSAWGPVINPICASCNLNTNISFLFLYPSTLRKSAEKSRDCQQCQQQVPERHHTADCGYHTIPSEMQIKHYIYITHVTGKLKLTLPPLAWHSNVIVVCKFYCCFEKIQ